MIPVADPFGTNPQEIVIHSLFAVQKAGPGTCSDLDVTSGNDCYIANWKMAIEIMRVTIGHDDFA